jgi:hypothetical protein
MAISFVAAGGVATQQNATVTLPAGIAAGDLLIIVSCGSSASTITATTYPGWTRILNQGAAQNICVHTKIANGADTSVVLSQIGNSSKAVMLAYRGCGWYDVVASINSGTGTNATTNTQTTGFANDYVTSIFATAASTTATFSPPMGVTTRVNSAPSGTITGLLLADELKATAGTTTARTSNLTTSVAWSTVSISIREPQTCYWVGASGTWSSTSKSNWATSSGGTAGTIVPGDDSVVFDQNSNTGTTAFTVTLSTADWARCDNFTTSSLDATMTLATGTINDYALIAYGDITFPATNFSITGAGGEIRLTPVGSKTFTTNGVTVNPNVTKEGTGTTTLGSALTVGNNLLTLSEGTFSTSASNFAITLTSDFIYLPTGIPATLSLNGSTVTLGSNSNWVFGSPVGLTFNAGTSLITFNTSGRTFDGGGLTYYDVSLRPSATLIGNNTYRNLTFQSGAANKSPVLLAQGATHTVTGTFTANGASNISRIFVTVSANTPVAGPITRATINTTNAPSLSNVDFYGIASAGTGGTWGGTSIGNVGFNTGITFTAAKTVYLVGNSATIEITNTNRWATTSGGTASNANYPIPQDTIIIDNSSSTDPDGILNINSANNWYPLIDASTRTSSLPITFGSGTTSFTGGIGFGTGTSGTLAGGDHLCGGDYSIPATGAAFTGTTLNSLTYVPNRSTTLTITSNGRTIGLAIANIIFSGNVNSSNIVLSGNFNLSTRPVTFGNVNLNLTSGSLTALTFTSTSTNTKRLTFGSNSITVGGSGTAINIVGTGLTCTGTGGLILNNTGAVATTVTMTTGFTNNNAPNLTVSGGTYALTFSSAFVNNLTFSSYTGTVNNSARTIYGNFLITGTNPTFTAGSAATTFAGPSSDTPNTYTITTNGASTNCPITFNGNTDTIFQLGSALTTNTASTNGAISMLQGEFNAITFNVTCWSFQKTGTNNTVVRMGSGLWTLAGTGTIWTTGAGEDSTLNTGTANILLSNTTNSATRIFGTDLDQNKTYNALTIGGGAATGQITQFIRGNTFTTLASTKTVAHTVQFTGGRTTSVTDFTITGTVGNVVTLSRTGSGTWTINKNGGGIVENINYLNISNSNATPADTWYAGANSTNGGNNTGWIFGGPSASNSNFFLLF